MDKQQLEKIIEKNKIKGDKIKKDLELYKYQTKQFFDKTTIVPTAHIGESSRKQRR
jgi:ethanolamine utilization cobalamin adenosyltransferase